MVDHRDVVEANGFSIRVHDSDEEGTRVDLVAVPFSQDVVFGVEDIRELASLISADVTSHQNAAADADEVSYVSNAVAKQSMHQSSGVLRLPKLTNVLASRACRSAIMIGTALSAPEMESVVRNMQSLDQPWNCPHGRPTMRHLSDALIALSSAHQDEHHDDYFRARACALKWREKAVPTS